MPADAITTLSVLQAIEKKQDHAKDRDPQDSFSVPKPKHPQSQKLGAVTREDGIACAETCARRYNTVVLTSHSQHSPSQGLKGRMTGAT